MGDSSERRETTNYAIQKISGFIDTKDFISALLLSSIYIDLRLRTLITDWVEPPKKNWKRMSSEVLKYLTFRELIQLSHRHKLILDADRGVLQDLFRKRNHVAHESTLWKKLTNADEKQIKILCDFAKTFLNRTSD